MVRLHQSDTMSNENIPYVQFMYIKKVITPSGKTEFQDLGLLDKMFIKRVTTDTSLLMQENPYYPMPNPIPMGIEARTLGLTGSFGEDSNPMGCGVFPPPAASRMLPGYYLRLDIDTTKRLVTYLGKLWLIDQFGWKRDAAKAGYLEFVLSLTYAWDECEALRGRCGW